MDYAPPVLDFTEGRFDSYNWISGFDYSLRLKKFWFVTTSKDVETWIYSNPLNPAITKPVYEVWFDKLKPDYTTHSDYMSKESIYELPDHYTAFSEYFNTGNGWIHNRAVIDLSNLKQNTWYELFGRVTDKAGNFSQTSRPVRVILMKPETNIFSTYVDKSNIKSPYYYHLNTEKIENYNNESSYDTFFTCWNYGIPAKAENAQWNNISYNNLRLSDTAVCSKSIANSFIRLLITTETENIIYAKVNIEYYSPDNWDEETKSYRNENWTVADIFDGANGVQYYTDQPMLIHTLYDTKNWGTDIDSWEMYGTETNVLQTETNGHYGLLGIPAQNYAVIIAYFADGTKLISRVYKK